MKQYIVTGMSCAACVARVEKAVNQVPGVDNCSVSLLTNSMGVEGNASEADIIAAVEKAGYGARAKNGNSSEQGKETTSSASIVDDGILKDRETPVLVKRLTASLVVLLVLVYFSMGHTMWGFPVPGLLMQNAAALGVLQMVLAALVMVINQKFFTSGFKSAIHLAPNMDTLVAMGSSVSFLYSVWTLFSMMGAQVSGGVAAATPYVHELYFETAAMIPALITIGKTLEARSKGKTTDALKSLMRLTPKTATVVRDGVEETIASDQVKTGDIFVVRPGESIPVDGMVLEGSSAVNEAALTGESIPVDKQKGDTVSAATINQSGFLRCEATRVGGDTTLAQIIQVVSDAAATKAPIAKIADKVAGVFVPVVLGIALITFMIWMLAGATVGNALSFAIAVLVISCPCSLGLATPVAIMVGNGVGARNGILFKTAAALEETARIQIVALDKTGTITSGEPKVTDLLPEEGVTVQKLLKIAFSLEQKSEHPLAKAILAKAGEEAIEADEVTEFTAVPGNGLAAKWQDKWIYGGNETYIRKKVSLSQQMAQAAAAMAQQGKTPLFFAREDKMLGIIAVADTLKEESVKAIQELHGMGLQVVMLTGDNKRTAAAIGAQAGVDGVIAGVLPEGKAAAIRRMQQQGKVAMVGDGINDAPALTVADMGIAIGAGTDVAIDAADVVLMKSHMTDVPAAIRLSRATLRNIRQNLFWAFFYNSIGIPVAAGVFVTIFGWKLNPMIGAAAMALSSFCVVMNALRLNLCRVYDSGKDKKIKTEKIIIEEEKTMTKTMKIEGMMCPHCEARVKKTLEAMEQVAEAVVSHSAGTAVLTLNAEVSDSVLKETVEKEGYTVTGIEG